MSSLNWRRKERLVKNEMDVMKMDERQRLCWLMANRATLLIVGLIWIGMIVWEVLHERIPYFLIVMVPVIALARLAMYLVYARRNAIAPQR
jgi:hypothetical protein